METPRRHQNSYSGLPKGEMKQGLCTKETIPKSPLLFCTPLKKPCSQLAKREDGEKHTSIAKENPKATDNFLLARINGTNAHNSTCSTPIKIPFGTSSQLQTKTPSQIPFGTPSQLQTPTSKFSFLSANGNKHFVGTGGYGMNDDASMPRTPFGLLAGKNLNACLFSPSSTLPVSFPTPFDKLASPSLKGRAKRVLVIPPQLSPAQRVPVKQKRSQLTTAGKQCHLATPKSGRLDNVQFLTPKSSRLDNASRAAGQNDDCNVMQHRDVHNAPVNYDKRNLEGSAWSKRVLASIPQQSPVATPNSSRVGHLLKTASQNSGVSGGEVMQHADPDVKQGRAELDSLEMLNRVLASMPQLSSPARRVPLQQKQKPPIKNPSPPHHKEKQQPTTKKSLSQNLKACKSGQRRKTTCQNEAGVLDAKKETAGSHQRRKMTCQNETGGVLDAKKETAGSHQKATKKFLKRVPKGKVGNGTAKTRQQSADNHETKASGSKQHDEDMNKKYGDDSINDEGNDEGMNKKYGDYSINDKGNNEDMNKKYGDDSINDVKGHSEDGKQHEACDVDVAHDECRDLEFEYGSDDTKQHYDDDGPKPHVNDSGEDDKWKSDNGGDNENQHKDSRVSVIGDNDTKECYGDSSEHCEDDNGTEPHNYLDGDDDGIVVGSEDKDDEKQHGDENITKQHDLHAKGVKQLHNDDAGRKQHNNDDGDNKIDIGGEDAECMKQHYYNVDISRDDDGELHDA